MSSKKIQNYADLFSKLDFKKGDSSRSVYSPAAYLADLLQLLDDYFDDSQVGDLSIDKRRNDIKNMKLDGSHTFDLLPYQDIVIDLLEKRKPGFSYGQLKDTVYPLHLPFNLEHEKVELFLDYAKVELEDIYRLFHRNPDASEVARMLLDWSPQFYQLVNGSRPLMLADAYGLQEGENSKTLKMVDRFMQATGIGGLQLQELLFGRLGENEANNAAQFFTNHGLGGYVALNEMETELTWKIYPSVEGPPPTEETESPSSVTDSESESFRIPETWYLSVNLFIRLANKLDISYTDLNLVLSSCCENRLDDQAIQHLAIIVQIAKKYDLSIEACCGLFSPINNTGHGDGEQPADLFNQLYNGAFTQVDKKYFKTDEAKAYQYNHLKEKDRLQWSADLSSTDNFVVRKRITSALNISDRDFQLIIDRYLPLFYSIYDAQENENVDAHLGHRQLSLFYRLVKLTEILEVSIAELFNLLDVLKKDTTIRSFSNFKTLIAGSNQTFDVDAVLMVGTVNEIMWLTEHLIAISEWLQRVQIAPAELKKIQTGDYENDKEKEIEQQKKIASLNQLYQQFKNVFFNADIFNANRFDQRASNVIYETLCDKKYGVTVVQDKRILRQKFDELNMGSLDSLRNLSFIKSQDFLHLGLEEKMQEKIFNNLVIKGFIKPDGTIIESAIPENVGDFSINNSDQSEQKELFSLLHNLYRSETNGAGNGHANGNGNQQEQLADDSFTVFLSDLDGLNLDEIRKTELYDNLIFNGYIDEEGTILKPGFFASPTNAPTFEANANIAGYSPQVYKIIQEKIKSFNQEDCKLTAEHFLALPLTSIEVNDLLENLQFNEYLDEDFYVKDKQAVLNLDVKDFKLVLMYYPHRYQILEIMQGVVSEFKAKYFKVTLEELQMTAQKMVADLAFEGLQNKYLHQNKFTTEARQFFNVSENIDQFNLGLYFDESANRIAFKAIQKIIKDADQFRFRAESLEAIGFEKEEADLIIDLLIEDNYILPSGDFTAEQIDYFLDINNALNLKVEDFDELTKDIFFVFHNVARIINNAAKEIKTTVSDLSSQQRNTLLAGLQEIFELPAAMIEVVSQHIYANEPNIVAAFMLPIFNTVNDKDLVGQIPDNYLFNTNFRRIHQFSLLAGLLNLSSEETDIVFRDQNLVEKFPEKLVLPTGLENFNALIRVHLDASRFIGLDQEGPLEVLMMMSVVNEFFWFYDAQTYDFIGGSNDWSKLSDELMGRSIDAAFNDQKGNAWLVSGSDFFCCEKESTEWTKKEKTVGLVQNNFVDPEKIDASFIDNDGKIYLFSGDQYLRCTDRLDQVDSGYPKKINPHWQKEFSFQLPTNFQEGIDAAFQDAEERLFFFKGDQFANSEDFSQTFDIKKYWGRVKSNFNNLQQLNATLALNEKVYFFSGDQVICWSHDIKASDGLADEGSIKNIKALIPSIPEVFYQGIDSVFRGLDDHLHIFKGDHYWQCNLDFSSTFGEAQKITDHWGKHKNQIQEDGTVTAALSGLDGKTYLFSGGQYYRYSGTIFNQVDEGYPKTIAAQWGGLRTVDAAFILDGKTYLFGESLEGNEIHVRYSTNDYTIHDEGYPKDQEDNWWANHFNLENTAFTKPDTVLNTIDGATYLIKGKEYIAYDQQHRWWTEPKPVTEKWNGINFNTIDAGFSSKDGRVYLFSGDQFARYTDTDFNKVDDDYPKPTKEKWGRIKNNIQLEKPITAALSIEAKELISEWEIQTEVTYRRTYLFSGDQFFRYTNDDYQTVDEGYPKKINTSLKKELRFEQLNFDFENSIDAAYADQRSVYLFSGNKGYAIAATKDQRFPAYTPTPVTSVFQDQGITYLQTESGWNEVKSPFGNKRLTAVDTPNGLADIPEEFSQGVDAVLKSEDGHVFIFNGNHCFNEHLNRAYLINEEWGIVDNHISLNNKVDAAFSGRDGYTYLFSGDQFVKYKQDQEASEGGRFIEELPQSISEYWGGLNNVQLAYVQDEKTYVLEAPDAEGNFRYLCYSKDDYTQADGPVQTADQSWWDFPESYREDGFNEVQAVLFDEHSMYLLNGDQFVQHEIEENVWTYPRPISRIWRNMPLMLDEDEQLVTAFTDAQGITHFFSKHHCCSFDNAAQSFVSDPMPVNEVWGLIDNRLAQHNKVDAAVTIEGVSFLFSGDQYIRYSKADYRMVDSGYPKSIVDNLRKEKGFENLPEVFEERLSDALSERIGIGAVNYVGNSTIVYLGTDAYLSASVLIEEVEVEKLGHTKNNFATNGSIDAAFVTTGGKTILFSGDQYIRYADTEYEYVDEGYPKSIIPHLEEEGLQASLSGMGQAVDAAFQSRAGHVFLFKGNQSYHSGWESPLAPLREMLKINPQPISAPFNAILGATDGKVYLFKGDEYIRYTDFEQEFIDEGYPKPIKDNWGNLPTEFELELDGAFVFEGKTYLTKSDQHVRYSGNTNGNIDAIYPQRFTDRWSDWNDFLLSDIHLISEFKRLDNQVGDEYTLSDLLGTKEAYVKTPYEMLAGIFDWNKDQVKWLKKHHAFMPDERGTEVNFNLETIVRIHQIFQLTDQLGTTPSDLYYSVWIHAWKENIEFQNWGAIAGSIHQYLGLNHSKKDWEQIKLELHDRQNELKHAALLPYIIANDTVDNARDLFANMLIDVQMGSEAKTSKIKEAIAALQLYFHRFFTNQESIKIKVDAGSEEAQAEQTKLKREQLKQWWKWMKNYRVWEANRKVFLYPENYIRPELRDTKTQAFKKLEETLLQGELNEASATKAYNEYLNEFATVGNLKISGANMYDDPLDPGDQILILFGYTRTDPIEYYYRTARFVSTGGIIWNNWSKMNIFMNSTRVFPVYAFGRVMAFWTEIEDYEEAKPLIINEKKTSSISNDEKILKHRADIKYSFYNFNEQWVNPQTLRKGVKLDYKIDAAFSEGDTIYAISGKYCMKSTLDHPQGEVQEIKEVLKGINKYFHNGIDAVGVFKGKRYYFKNEYFAIDNGSPRRISSTFIHTVNTTTEINGLFVSWKKETSVTTSIPLHTKGVAAAIVNDNTFTLIDHGGHFYFFKEAIQEDRSIHLVSQENIHNRNFFWFSLIRILTRNFLRLSPVDAIFKDKNGVWYILRNGLYECYVLNQNASLPTEKLVKMDGFPKPIRGNLSFNMDKFFNKLHVVRSSDEEGEFINLSYITPQTKNGSLLNGKIKSDFSFEEGDLRIDHAKLELLKLISRTDSYDNSKYENLNNDLDPLGSLFENNKVVVEGLVEMEQGINNFNTAVGLIGEIVLDNNELDREDRTADTDKVTSINSLLSTASTIFTNVNSEQLRTLATELDNEIGRLEDALKKYVAKPTTKTPFATLKREHLAADSAIPDQRTSLSNILISVQQQFNDLLSSGETNSRLLFNYNRQFFPKYRGVLNVINRTITNEERKIKFLGNSFFGVFTNRSSELLKTLRPVQKLYQEQLSKVEKLTIQFDQNLMDIASSDFTDPVNNASFERAYEAKSQKVKGLDKYFKALNEVALTLDSDANKELYLELQELYFGKFDLFDSRFDIQNRANFTFAQPDWYVFEAKRGTFLCRPLSDTNPKYEIIRLTTTMIPDLSNQLFTGGIKQLLDMSTQQFDEVPYFAFNFVEEEPMEEVSSLTTGATSENTVFYSQQLIAKYDNNKDRVPHSEDLDFRGASSNYYWEIFFHAPFLIAQALNQAQQFDEAKKWYEYVFDPSANKSPWQFLPFTKGPDSKVTLKTELEEYLSGHISISNLEAEMKVYLNDPFDPHAIARIRQIAYKKAIVMNYIDNLIDWGDMLFGQYTMESINEARMLYVLAYDLLGEKPQVFGSKKLSTATNYNGLQDDSSTRNDLLLKGTPHQSVERAYFFIPSNTLFHDYWNRVEDRLFKIRNSLNIDGIKQTLPLFQPPIDPMSIVQAIGNGASLSQALGSLNVALPHYRLRFMLQKARELTQKLNQYGNELLGVIEKKEGEAMSLLQNRQEGTILSMMTNIKKAQLDEAKESVNALKANLAMVEANEAYNKGTFETGILPTEGLQIASMSAAVVAHTVSTVLKIVAAIGGAVPDVKIGIDAGPEIGGKQVERSASDFAESIQGAAEGLSILGEIFGIAAQHQRMMADTEHAFLTAKHDRDQITSQLESARIQIKVAEYELAMHEKEIEQHESISRFMKGKFTNEQLYLWMSSKLSGLYYQTYQMALEMARAAEKAYQYERGVPTASVNFIKGNYWDSQRKGLLSGEQLEMDLDRMEAAFMKTDRRRLEISKSVSLLQLDPQAFMQLKAKGICEFEFDEAFFDYDFPGHYCRQIKTLSVSFEAADGETVNATLTQLANKIVMEPDAKAVKYLIQPRNDQPTSIRSDWRASQQIVLSHVDEYEVGNGLFELRYDDDKYLPFEGTGAVSRWQLELNGKRGSVTLDQLTNLKINLKYTALSGGDRFKDVVKGLLKPYYTAHLINVSEIFSREWFDFLDNEETLLKLPMRQDLFPNMASSKITGIYARFESSAESTHRFTINDNDSLQLKQDQFLETSGLKISSRGSEWSLKLKGDKSSLNNLFLIIGYKAKV